ncbi:MAG: hypothetical protein KBT32_00035 [Bacteroidales bacterium]|nr:hypothetical protein [Candidatus Physcocola equi]
MGIIDKIAGLFSFANEDKETVSDEIEPVVGLPATKAEDDHFYNGVKRVKRYQAYCSEGGLLKSCLESVWTYSPEGYLTEFTSYTSKGNVCEHYVFEYNEKNKLTKTFYNDFLQTENKYDETGLNNIEELTYGEDATVAQKWVGTYDESNHLVRGVTYVYINGTCSVLSRSESSYDAAGNHVNFSSEYEQDASMNSKMEMQYDERGNMISMTEYGPDGEFVSQNVYRKNDHGLEVLRTLLNAKGEIVARYESDYDSQDNLLKWTSFGANGEIIVSSESSYKYDEKGNYIEQINIENGAFDTAFVHELEYYD